MPLGGMVRRVWLMLTNAIAKRSIRLRRGEVMAEALPKRPDFVSRNPEPKASYDVCCGPAESAHRSSAAGRR